MPPGQPTHATSRDATQTQKHTPTARNAGIRVASKLDQVLAQQDREKQVVPDTPYLTAGTWGHIWKRVHAY
jgi:hypothetical protein